MPSRRNPRLQRRRARRQVAPPSPPCSGQGTVEPAGGRKVERVHLRLVHPELHDRAALGHHRASVAVAPAHRPRRNAPCEPLPHRTGRPNCSTQSRARPQSRQHISAWACRRRAGSTGCSPSAFGAEPGAVAGRVRGRAWLSACSAWLSGCRPEPSVRIAKNESWTVCSRSRADAARPIGTSATVAELSWLSDMGHLSVIRVPATSAISGRAVPLF